MPPLEKLFRLEIEFHRRLRTQTPGTADARALHTSYALQAGYEPLIRQLGSVTAQDVERLHARLALAGDPRDLLAVRDSLKAPPWPIPARRLRTTAWLSRAATARWQIQYNLLMLSGGYDDAGTTH